MNVEYLNAFYEVLQVLKYVPKDDYDKIPKNFIKFLNDNYNENSSFEYNLALSMKEQELSTKAKIILAIICEKYWNNHIIANEILDLDDEKVKTLIKSEDIKNNNILLRLINKILNILK